jgi:lysophospholipase L1-like esterase
MTRGLFRTPPGQTRRPAIGTTSRLIHALLTFLTALGLVAGVSAIPAAASSSSTYYGLGDSIAAGTGAEPTASLTLPCLQSSLAYPTQIAAAKNLAATNLGCYGATTIDEPGSANSVQSQAMQLTKYVRNVTITVGANDVGAGNVAVTCETNAAACQQAIAYSTLVLLPQLPAKLAATISAVRAHAPAAHITFTGYPLLFTVPGLSPAEQPIATEINAVTTALNQTIAFTALTHGARYADVTLLFYNHGIGSLHPWINPLTFITATTWDPGSFHPNHDGYTYGYVPAVAPLVN